MSSKNYDWKPMPGTRSFCETSIDPVWRVSFVRSDPIETVIHNACVAMMPECAFRDRLSNGTICSATVDYPLDGNKYYKPPNVDAVRHNGTDWQLIPIMFVVRPGGRVNGTPDTPVFWRVEDCYGYLFQFFEKLMPEGCRNSEGYRFMGQLAVAEGGSLADAKPGSLAGTKFFVTFDNTGGGD
ncbi:hypothetical protein COCCADRAFT_95055 [Bipolaris zeicola 26-R-13]|uniref:Uncharacterized protein n=1 Tax=Cochliobolus carbonum (strain 26-R-13) TaxID=930089 RepID=W6Y2A9_COCC2|nr:uncharacterized protein COCCADRAFT_95055 [Bipolaris zeicola 26-R-13]EUC33857.1 hypothetical protein COCCADRAFT_95055 [Bipolaris zeicola 26-R-13]